MQSVADPVFNKFNFYTANPKTKLNRRRLIRTNSIYDDNTEDGTRKPSEFMKSFTSLLNNITLHCYNRMLEADRSIIEKYEETIIKL